MSRLSVILDVELGKAGLSGVDASRVKSAVYRSLKVLSMPECEAVRLIALACEISGKAKYVFCAELGLAGNTLSNLLAGKKRLTQEMAEKFGIDVKMSYSVRKGGAVDMLVGPYTKAGTQRKLASYRSKLKLKEGGVEELQNARYKCDQTRYAMSRAKDAMNTPKGAIEYEKCIVAHKEATEALKDVRVANKAILQKEPVNEQE